MNGIKSDNYISVGRRLSFFTILFYTVYLLITFSGSTAIKLYIPYLFIIYPIVCAGMAITKQGKRAALINKYKSLQYPFLFVIAFSLYLVYQLSFAYVPTIVRVYIRRYLVLALMFVFVPRFWVYEKAIKYSKIYSVAVAISIIVMTAIGGEKTGGLVGDFQAGGMMMSIACIIFLIEYYENSTNRFNLIWLLLSITGLLISGKRMFTLIVVFAFFVLFINSERKGRFKKFISGILLGVIGLLVIITVVPSAREVFDRTMGLAGNAKYFTSGRNVLWEKALIAFKDNKLFGIGFGAFQAYFRDNYIISGIDALLTHNIYIGLLAETGIIGTVIYLGFMVTVLVETLKIQRPVFKLNDQSMRYVFLNSLLLQFWFIIYGFSGNGIYDANETFFYFSAIAMMLSLKMELNRRKRLKKDARGFCDYQ